MRVAIPDSRIAPAVHIVPERRLVDSQPFKEEAEIGWRRVLISPDQRMAAGIGNVATGVSEATTGAVALSYNFTNSVPADPL